MIRILKFEDNVKNRSKCYNLSAKCQVHQNAEIWVKSEDRSICQIWVKVGESIKHWNLKTKLGINQNVEIWVLITKSFKMLNCEWKVGNQSKSWRLCAIRLKLITMLKFSAKCQIDQNVEIWAKKGSSIKCWYSIAKVEIDQIIGIWLKNNWSENWNLRTMLRIDQNVEIWVQNVKSIKMLKFEWKRKFDQKCPNLSERGESIKTLKFKDKVGNQSKCWNLSANGQIDQNVEIWVKQQ